MLSPNLLPLDIGVDCGCTSDRAKMIRNHFTQFSAVSALLFCASLPPHHSSEVLLQPQHFLNYLFGSIWLPVRTSESPAGLEILPAPGKCYGEAKGKSGPVRGLRLVVLLKVNINYSL